MFRRTVSAILLAAFAAVSLLGHGGLHLLPGGHDCHSHTGTGGSAAGHVHQHADDQAASGHHCLHSHVHHVGHWEGEQSPARPAPQVPTPHDDDNCLVCQWHAQGQLSAVTLAVSLSQACCGEVTRPAPQVTTAFRLSTLLTRGPPVA
jgi:hypothetical protein